MIFQISPQIIFIFFLLCFIYFNILFHLFVVSFNRLPFSWYDSAFLRNSDTLLSSFLLNSFCLLNALLCSLLCRSIKLVSLQLLHFEERSHFEYFLNEAASRSFPPLLVNSQTTVWTSLCMLTFDIFCFYKNIDLHQYAVGIAFFMIHRKNQENNMFYAFFKGSNFLLVIISNPKRLGYLDWLQCVYAFARSYM